MDEQNLPIDIQLKKLLDWLISRRICNRSWHENIVNIREKIGHAIGDMPEHPKIKDLLSGTNISYFHCLRIVDILKDTEKDTKNFFGSYGSQRMKDWQEVTKLYQRDAIYLAEAAQLLSQSVTYEIPGLKKQLAKTIQIQEECDKREKDNIKKAKEFRAEFDKSCQQLGISGKKIRREIIDMVSTLPQTYEVIAKDCQKLKPFRAMYCDFLKATLNDDFKEEDVLSTVAFLVAKGNVTTYEWIHGEPPLSIEETSLVLDDKDDDDEATNNDGDTIDFGDDAIDFSAEDVDLDTGAEIDWGNLDSAEVQDAGEIDWGQEDGAAAVDIVVEDGGVAGGVARDSEALTLLDNPKTRGRILDELTELECFLDQRQHELIQAEEGNFTLSTGVSKNENVDELAKGVSIISDLTARLNTGKIHHLQLIRSSPKYVDRLVDSLKMKLSLEDKMKVSNQVIAERRDNAIQEQAQIQKKVEKVKAKTKELQADIEADISKRYKNRPVNIMGGVQST